MTCGRYQDHFQLFNLCLGGIMAINFVCKNMKAANWVLNQGSFESRLVTVLSTDMPVPHMYVAIIPIISLINANK